MKIDINNVDLEDLDELPVRQKLPVKKKKQKDENPDETDKYIKKEKK